MESSLITRYLTPGHFKICFILMCFLIFDTGLNFCRRSWRGSCRTSTPGVSTSSQRTPLSEKIGFLPALHSGCPSSLSLVLTPSSLVLSPCKEHHRLQTHHCHCHHHQDLSRFYCDHHDQDIPREGLAEDLQDPSQDPTHLPHDPGGPLYKSM